MSEPVLEMIKQKVEEYRQDRELDKLNAEIAQKAIAYFSIKDSARKAEIEKEIDELGIKLKSLTEDSKNVKRI